MPRPEERPELLTEAADPVELLLARCLSVPERERSAAFERALGEHPELADELRLRIEALRALGIDALGADDESAFPEQLGDFRLMRRLGGGGMGVVFAAVQTSLQRDVALKLVRPERLYFAGSRERFRREAEAVARLQHPGIVPIYTVGEDAGLPWFAMELVPGRTLGQALARLRGKAPESLTGADLRAAVGGAAGDEASGPDAELAELPELFRGSWTSACLRVASRVAEALEHAHGRGILHRDVKPSNVMVAPDGRVVLLDFGLTSAAEGDRMTRTGSSLGTLHYMAPEQLRGAKDVDARADVYGLGATLYELLTLQLPHGEGDELEVQRRIAEGHPDSIRARNRRVPQDVETVCMQALDPQRERRYPSAAALSRDLGHLLAHRPIEARPPGPWLRARRWAQRRPALATGCALGALLATGIPTALFLQERMHAGELRAAFQREREARTEAQENLRLARLEGDASARMTDFLAGLFHRAAATLAAGETLTAAGVLDFGLERVDQEFDQAWLRGRALRTLGRVHLELRDYERALPPLERAAHEFESISDEDDVGLGSISVRDTDLGGICVSMAEALRELGRLDEAEAQARRALELWADLRGTGRPHVDHAEQVLASVLATKGRDAEALELRRAIVLRGVEGGTDPAEESARAMAQLGVSLLQQRRYEEALELLEPALTGLRQVLGERHHDLITLIANVGFAAKGLGQLERAQELYDEALALARAAWPADNATVASLLVNRAALLETRGELAPAIAVYREALSTLEALLPAGDPTLATATGNLARALALGGERAEARELAKRALAWHEAVVGTAHPRLAACLLTLARCAREEGESEEAAIWLERAQTALAGTEGWPNERAELEAEAARLAEDTDLERPG